MMDETMDDLKATMRKAIDEGIRQATSDLFRWSGSHIYESGVESLLEVRTAERVFSSLKPEYQVKVRMQFRTSDLTKLGVQISENFRSGRIDLLCRHERANCISIVEFKRSLTYEKIKDDIARLASITASAQQSGINAIGWIAGPMYQKVGKTWDFKGEYKNHLEKAKEQWADHHIEETVSDYHPIDGAVGSTFMYDSNLSILVEVSPK